MNKKALAVAVAAALAVPMAAHAVKYSLSGQVTQAIHLIDTGEVSDIQFAALGATGSRLELKGSEELESGNKLGFHWEIQHSLTAPVVNGNAAAASPSIRYMNGSISGNWGKVSLGQISDATDNSAFADLGGNSWLAIETSCDYATTTAFRTSTGALFQDAIEAAAAIEAVDAVAAVYEDVIVPDGSGGTTESSILTIPAVEAVAAADAVMARGAVTLGSICPSFDGGRSAGLRYDSPTFGGIVNGKFSYHNADKWTLQVSASGEANGIAYAANYGYSDNGKADDASGTWVVSGSVKAPTGTSLSVRYGEQEQGGTAKDVEGYSIKVAHQLKPSTSVVGIYRTSENSAYSAENCNNDGYCGGSSWGLGAVHGLGASGVSLILGWQHHELDDVAAGKTVEDIEVFYLGTRYRFN